MQRRWSVFMAATAAALLTSSAAMAQTRGSGGLGSQGQLVLSAERLYGLHFWHDKDERSDRVDERDGTSISFLMPSVADFRPASIPRVGVDYLPIDILTVGASAGVFSSSGEIKRTDRDTGRVNEADAPGTSGFVFGPRVGGAIAINDIFTIWPRGGLTFYRFASKQEAVLANGVRVTEEVSTSGILLEAECVFAIMPAHNFGFGFTPLISLPLSGTDKSESSNGVTTNTRENDHGYRAFGVTGSILGFF